MQGMLNLIVSSLTIPKKARAARIFTIRRSQMTSDVKGVAHGEEPMENY